MKSTHFELLWSTGGPSLYLDSFTPIFLNGEVHACLIHYKTRGHHLYPDGVDL